MAMHLAPRRIRLNCGGDAAFLSNYFDQMLLLVLSQMWYKLTMASTNVDKITT